MRLLRVISSTNPEGGGPIEGIKQQNVPLCALGAEIEIACCDSPDAPWLVDKDLPKTHALGPRYGKYSYTPRLMPWLRENLHRFDAILVEGIWSYGGFAVHRVVKGSGVPYFVFTHGMLDPWFKRTYPVKHLKKWLYWPWAGYPLLRDASAVLFTCEEERLLARQAFWLYRANEKVTSFGTAYPPDNSEELVAGFLSSYPHLQGKRIILFLSRIHEKKGCDLLVEAFARISKIDERLHLVIAGPDQTDWTTSLQRQSEDLGIAGRITWPGMLQGREKWGAFYAAEVLCLPSHQENFGIVVAEALGCGKPVLISNKVNIWREIVSSNAGFVDDDTIEGTFRNFQRWLELDCNKYNQVSENAKKCFAEHFHIQRAAEQLIEIVSRKN